LFVHVNKLFGIVTIYLLFVKFFEQVSLFRSIVAVPKEEGREYIGIKILVNRKEKQTFFKKYNLLEFGKESFKGGLSLLKRITCVAIVNYLIYVRSFNFCESKTKISSDKLLQTSIRKSFVRANKKRNKNF